MKALIPVMPRSCTTCPFRPESEYRYLIADLTVSALSVGSRICHSTGTNAIGGRTRKPNRLCRGARNAQLEVFAALGVISEATDEAWQAKCEEMELA